MRKIVDQEPIEGEISEEVTPKSVNPETKGKKAGRVVLDVLFYVFGSVSLILLIIAAFVAFGCTTFNFGNTGDEAASALGAAIVTPLLVIIFAIMLFLPFIPIIPTIIVSAISFSTKNKKFAIIKTSISVAMFLIAIIFVVHFFNNINVITGSDSTIESTSAILRMF